MRPATKASNETTIERLRLLDRAADPSLTALLRVGAHVLGVDTAAAHILDEASQHRVAGVNAPLGPHPRFDSMCRIVVDGAEPVVTPDASRDPRFSYSSFVAGPTPVRFYASMPMVMVDGTIVGTLCAWDTEVHEPSDEQVERFSDLAHHAAALTQLVHLAADLGEAATRDPLTGCVNRLLLDDRLAQAFARRLRHGGEVLVAMIDVDQFKVLNDTFGHDVGDEMLRTIAHRLRQALRSEDTVARLGGDEFAVVAETATGALSLEDLVGRVEQGVQEPVFYAGVRHEVSVSVGATVALPGEGIRATLRRADQAMYAVKRAGHGGGRGRAEAAAPSA